MSNYPEGLDYPDPEKVVGAILRPAVENDFDIGNFLVVDFEQVEEYIGNTDRLFVTVRERGGSGIADDFTNYPNVEVSCWGKSRSVARNGMDQVLKLVLQSGGTEVDGVLVDSAEDVTGAEEPVLENPDDRCLTRMFQLGFRPNYQD